MMIFTAAIIALNNSDISPGLVGFSLLNASSFGAMILYFIRKQNSLEIELTSFQRVTRYATLHPETPPENPPILKDKPPETWPGEGGFVVKDLTVKYATDERKVLHNVTFSINPKERIGICGRTGSGKSTLGLTLLRFTMKVRGSIMIGGIDIEEVDHETLRERVSIIPQDAVLFRGTIRSNLDPFGRLDDAELNMVLRQSGLDEEMEMPESSAPESSEITTVEEGDSGAATPRRKITLDTPVKQNGDNFSQGITYNDWTNYRRTTNPLLLLEL